MERQQQIDILIQNELNANKLIVQSNVIGAIILDILWLLYVTKTISVSDDTYLLINIAMPVLILVLLSCLFWARTKYLTDSKFKYFLVTSFLFVIFILNVIIPKHAIIGWAAVIVLTSHYFNPKFSTRIFVVTLVLMLVAIYLGMLFGEYDANIMEKRYLVEVEPGVFASREVNGVANRIAYLNELKANGDNRYLKAFLFYFLARAALLSLIYYITYRLNRRTFKLLENVQRNVVSQQKISTELNIARDIQMSALPKEFASSTEMEVVAELNPAKTVGGDFYDYYRLDADHVALLIGDVSGKGIPAAMFMMKSITCFKNFIASSTSPSEILKKVNKTLYENNDSNMFVTCFLALINTKTGVMKYANCGHNPPIVGKCGNFKYLNCNSGFILGVMDEAICIDQEYQLSQNEVISLYTDGITEAKGENGELFGEKRLIDFYNHTQYESIVGLHHNLKDTLADFIGKEDQADDMTYLIAQFLTDDIDSDEVDLEANLDNIQKLYEISETILTNNQLPQYIAKCKIIIDEIASNIAKYAYVNHGNMFYRISVNKTKGEITLTFIDQGKKFNPLETNNQKISGDVSEISIGGLGILMVKQMVDHFSYNYLNQKNIVVLKMKIK